MAGAYRAACTAAGTRVLASVEDSFNSGLTELLLNGNRTVELLSDRLTDLDLAPLAVALSEGHPFVKVNLAYNTLGAGAAESICQLLKSNSTIQELDLSENFLTGKVIASICDALKSNTSLRELRLSGNALGAEGEMAIAQLLQVNTFLQRVYLANTELSTSGLVALATAMRENGSVQVLDVARALARTIMDEPAQHLARALKMNATLIELDVSKLGLRDFGLQLIAEAVHRAAATSSLQVLRANCNQIRLVDDDCVGSLAMLLTSDSCRVSTLMLGGNDLRDEGTLKLAEMVEHNRSLVHLDVGSNSLTSRGLCALARAANHHLKLDELNLWGNSFDSAACLTWFNAQTNANSSTGKLRLDVEFQLVDGSYHCARA